MAAVTQLQLLNNSTCSRDHWGVNHILQQHHVYNTMLYSVYSDPSILQPFILRPPSLHDHLICSRSAILCTIESLFKTTCNISPHFHDQSYNRETTVHVSHKLHYWEHYWGYSSYKKQLEELVCTCILSVVRFTWNSVYTAINMINGLTVRISLHSWIT